MTESEGGGEGGGVVCVQTLQERRRAVEEVQGQGHAAAVHKKLDLSQSKVCDGATYIFSVTLIEGVVTD